MTTRFAPSPTGPLHLGHAFSAMLAFDTARNFGGAFLLRIEDIDTTRSRQVWEHQIYSDLAWLGLNWPQPVMRQSARMMRYQSVLKQLWGMGLLYPCTCTRRDISMALSAPQEGAEPNFGPDGPGYPGTCRPDHAFRPSGALPTDAALRLNMAAALHRIPSGHLTFNECGRGPSDQSGVITTDDHTAIQEIGDVVLARRDIGASYHLAVVVDDADQGITRVIRGEDLFSATPIHVVLQSILGFSTPEYHHHRLVRDSSGKRLAKRDDARAIETFRTEGMTPDQIREMVGL
ncbi:MAG: tRNA glutamyl-Q(34) synthetase GluQRS [Pseudomonadota bacterium]